MQNTRQVIWGIVTALVSLVLILGALFLTVSEGNQPVPTSTLLPTQTLLPTLPAIKPSSIPLINTATPLLITQTSTPLLPSLTASQIPSLTPALTPSLTTCPPPPGWLPYTVRTGDTLNGLALRYKRTSAEIGNANCLGIIELVPGMIIYLPPVPTHTPIPCGHPRSWVIYIVQQGDTLYRLSKTYGVTVAQLEKANCTSGSLIYIGQSLFVPPWGPLFPSPTYDPMLETTTTADTPTDVYTASDTPTP